MTIREDGTLGVRRPEDAPSNQPWRWLATFICAVIICLIAVASVGTFINGGLHG